MEQQQEWSEIQTEKPEKVKYVTIKNKKELSFASPFARSVAGDVSQRANANLYITESERELWFNNHFFVFDVHQTKRK